MIAASTAKASHNEAMAKQCSMMDSSRKTFANLCAVMKKPAFQRVQNHEFTAAKIRIGRSHQPRYAGGFTGDPIPFFKRKNNTLSSFPSKDAVGHFYCGNSTRFIIH
jgi:hypothetical protein